LGLTELQSEAHVVDFSLDNVVDHKRTIAFLAQESAASVDEVTRLYELERAGLEVSARIKRFLPIFVMRNVRATLRQRRLKLAMAPGQLGPSHEAGGQRARRAGGTLSVTRQPYRSGRLMTMRTRWATRKSRARQLFGALLIAACGISVAPSAGGAVPSNARASSFGAGWDCVWGYRQVDGHCEVVRVPANGYVESSGTGWECNRGFFKIDQHCVKANVPANAHLDESWLSSRGWQCNRRFHKVGEACARIILPANAYLGDSNYGREWECERGFRVAGGRCVSVQVPVNGYLTSAGDDWKCERGFARHGEACIAVAVPANGYLGSDGDRWQCERGFRREGSACVQLVIPPNAYIDYSGNEWRCVDGFRKRGGVCLTE
jgi:hypothetical protein